MSKQATKRKITVEVAPKTGEQPKARPSVFERLGTKQITAPSQSNEYCRHWSQNGTCPYGKSCKYASTHTLTSPSKRAAKKDEQKKQNRTGAVVGAGAAPGATNSKDELNKRLHSTIVKALRSPEPEWEQWNQTDLEDADADMLEKRRQELQRELELQMKMESKLTKNKEKTAVAAKKGSSSSSSNTSSSSTESSSSSEETSSTSSSTSLDSRSRKAKRTKMKRDSSSSTEPERRKKKPTVKLGHKRAAATTSNAIKLTDKKKTSSPALLKHSGTAIKVTKSPSPLHLNRRTSLTPPLKPGKMAVSAKCAIKPSSRSPRSQSQPERNKEKHRTPSPKLPSVRDRDRERVKEKERARDKEREKTREKERERERDREKVRDKGEKAREPHANTPKTNNTRSPKRATSRQSRDLSKKKESPTETRPSDVQKSRTASVNSGGAVSNPGALVKRDAASVASSKDKEERRLERSRDDDNNKKKDERERRDRDRERERERERDVKDRSLERKKDKDKEKEKEKRVERDDSSRDRRERERERRMTREEREAAREKEREEALARCQERQRERERLKELAKKERENIPSLLHINTGAATNVNRIRERDRGLDKPPADRVERLLPLPADRIPPMRKELERQAARSQDRTSNRSNERPDRNRSANRGNGTGATGVRDREPERAPTFEYRENRERDRDRDFPALGARAPREERRHDEKSYESPYRRDERPPSYLALDHEHYDNTREREYPEERRGSRRDTWDSRDIEPADLVISGDERRRVYGGRERERERDEVRTPSVVKERTWENPEYVNNRAEWERNRRHEWPDADWEPADHNSVEEEWRHYNRSMDSWPSDERRRWPGPTSTSSHRDTDEHLEPPLALPIPVDDVKKDTVLGKRIAESAEDIPEVKKTCVAVVEDASVLEDALSEISDDADEILNREDVEELHYSDNNNVNQFETNIHVAQQFHKNDSDFECAAEQSKDTSSGEEVTKKHVASPAIVERELEEPSEVKIESPKEAATPLLGHEHENNNEDESGGMDEDGIDNMDFEEISDEELEEEVKVKGLGDALGVDWASLVAECRPRPRADKVAGAKKRWDHSSVLARIGVSLEMAGNDDDVLRDVRLLGRNEAIAGIQVAKLESALVRGNLFASAGPHRRALSARRDLAIRRHLCNLPLPRNILERPLAYAAPPDPHFYETVLNTISIK